MPPEGADDAPPPERVMHEPAAGASEERAGFAYLLLTHARPQQVEDLGARLLHLSPGADLVVHHDATVHELPWAGRSTPRIHFVDRQPVQWGGWSMIEATERLLRFAVDNLSSEWFVLLSGDHRPVRDLSAWEDTLTRAPIDAYLPAVRLPERLRFGRRGGKDNDYLARARHRWITVARPKSPGLDRGIGGLMKVSQWVQPLVSLEFVHRLDAWAVGLRRNSRAVKGLTFYRGTQWIALNRRAAVAALTVEPRWREWFLRSWIPDETYFHTVLRAAGLRISNSPTTYVPEEPPHPTPGWMQLQLDDLQAVWASGTAFARKVDVAARPEVAAALDEAVDGGGPRATPDSAAEVSRDTPQP